MEGTRTKKNVKSNTPAPVFAASIFEKGACAEGTKCLLLIVEFFCPLVCVAIDVKYTHFTHFRKEDAHLDRKSCKHSRVSRKNLLP